MKPRALPPPAGVDPPVKDRSVRFSSARLPPLLLPTVQLFAKMRLNLNQWPGNESNAMVKPAAGGLTTAKDV